MPVRSRRDRGRDLEPRSTRGSETDACRRFAGAPPGWRQRYAAVVRGATPISGVDVVVRRVGLGAPAQAYGSRSSLIYGPCSATPRPGLRDQRGLRTSCATPADPGRRSPSSVRRLLRIREPKSDRGRGRGGHGRAGRDARRSGTESRAVRGGRRGDRRASRGRPTAARAAAGTSSGEPAADAWVMRPGCSISDSTAPSDSASVKTSRARDEVERGGLTAAGDERDHAAERPHLTLRDRRDRGGRRGPGRAPARPRDGREQVDDGGRVLAVPIHAHAERLQPAEHEVAVERRRHRADGVLQEPQLVGAHVVVERDEPADDVGVAAEVLRRRVHDDVGADVAAATAGTASRTCCRRPRARRARARSPRPARCRRPSASGSSASRSTPSASSRATRLRARRDR